MLRHAHWNQAANTAIKAHNVHMLAVWESTSMAWDGHVDHGDCTHYCQRGRSLRSWGVASIVTETEANRKTDTQNS